jgi:thiamine biosynthesis lipoprotein
VFVAASTSLLLSLGCTSGRAPGLVPAPRPTIAPESPRTAPASADTAPPPAAPPQFHATKVERHETAMGTRVTFVAFTTEKVDERATTAAMAKALAEIARLESLLSEWRDDSDIGRVNAKPGEWVKVGPESLEVIDKSLWAGGLSSGVFDVTFQALGDVWKFGSASDPTPRVPTRAEIETRRKLVDYRQVETNAENASVRIGRGQKLGLGGIAKGYIVDRAARVLRDAGLDAFLVQAGGDLYGAGKKPDGSPWVSGIQDPRGAIGQFFATIALEDHAFSTAGDYARAYVVNGKRYHHIIDPRTGYPATACRSVTVWAKDAFLADAVDDIVFILGPEKGLPLVESLEDVGVVIVDAKNRVIVSRRLEGRVSLLHAPSDGI